jgi:hypothetical protein
MKMPTLDELLKQFGIDNSAAATSSPRGKLLAQADRMLTELAKYKTEAEMDGESAKYWWAPQSVNGKRRITARYGSKAVKGFSAYADNTLESVRATIETFRKLIEASDDDTWADEEKRRQK